MKKITLIALSLILAFSLSACIQVKDKPVSMDDIQTLGDVFNLPKSQSQYSVYDGKAVIAFESAGEYWRVIADVPADIEKKYLEIDISKEDAGKEQEKVLKNVKVSSKENLNEYIIKDEDKVKLIGKTGEELLKEGWTPQGTYEQKGSAILMEKDIFLYRVVFEGDLPNGDFEPEKAIKDLKVQSIEVSGLGEATNVFDKE